MEPRETPRIPTAGDPARAPGSDRDTGRRFARFVPAPGVRRIALPRLVLAVLASAGALGVLAVVGRVVVTTVVAYLHRQPEYQFAFGAIELVPPPPAWFRGGKAAFLERVRTRNALPERQSILDLDLKRLELAFQLDCWVKKVERVERKTFPNRVVIHLAYREPVALVDQESGRRGVLVDAEGVILPEADVIGDRAGPWIRISGDRRRPSNPRPGETWKKTAAGTGESEVDELIVAASGLAGLLKSAQEQSADREMLDLGFSVLARKSGLYVCFGDRVFEWQAAPRSETDEGLTAQMKWDFLRESIVQDRRAIHRYDKGAPFDLYSIRKNGAVKVKIPANRRD